MYIWMHMLSLYEGLAKHVLHTYKLYQTSLPCCLQHLFFFFFLFSVPFFPFSISMRSLFLSLYSIGYLYLLGLNFFFFFLSNNVRPTMSFGLFCIRSTTRNSFWPLVPIGSIPPREKSFFNV